MLLADIMFKHTSFKAFADAYNFLYAGKMKIRYLMSPKNLSDVFYAFEILKFNKEHNIDGQIKSNKF
jgi:hypothetical protein